MRTPKHMESTVKNGIITDEILGSCIFSCNKRAKNYRNKKRESTKGTFKYFDYEYMEEKYYSMKDEFLSILKPECVHKEIRTYHHFDYRNFEVDWTKTTIRYYLLYRVGSFSFHHPISEDAVPADLPVKEIGALETTGWPSSDLLSVQFCEKVLKLIRSGNYTYDPQEPTGATL